MCKSKLQKEYASGASFNHRLVNRLEIYGEVAGAGDRRGNSTFASGMFAGP
jgi:hypothetical protein